MMKLALWVGAAALSLIGGTVSAQQVSVGTSPQGTANYSIAAAIAKVMSDKAGLQARVQPFTGNSIAITQVNTGEIDFATCNEIEVVEALRGDGGYEGKKQENIRMVTVLYPFSVAMFTKKDSPIKTLADLKGKRVPLGYTAQLTLKAIVGAHLANGNVAESDVVPVLVPNVNRSADDFVGGKADVFFHSVGSAKTTEADASVSGIRAIPLDTSAAAMARLNKIVAEAYAMELKPRPGRAGINEPTKLMSYDYTLVAGKHVKDELVQRVAKALAENRQLMGETFAPMQDFDPKRMGRKMAAQFHPGAISYLQTVGQWPPKS
jgi:TRAP transporter TAXI family solute receptor